MEVNTGFVPKTNDTDQEFKGHLAQTTSTFFTGLQNHIASIDKGSGSINFRIALKALTPENVTQTITDLSTSSNGKTVFAATGYIGGILVTAGNIFAIDAQNGQIVWSMRVQDIAENSTLATDIATTGQKLILLTDDEVIALSPSSGSKIWHTALETKEGEAISLGGTNILVANDGIYANAAGGLFRINPVEGSIEWKFYVNGSNIQLGETQLAISNKSIYYSLISLELASGIRVLNKNNGKLKYAITSVDFNDTEVKFGALGGIAAKNRYLIYQSAINTIGIELPK